MSSLLPLWLQAKEASGVSKSTLTSYRKFTETFYPDHAAEEITPSDIRAYLIKLRNKNLSTHTIHDYYRYAKALMAWLVFEDLLERSPFERVPPPKKDQLMKPALSKEEMAKLLLACEGDGWQRKRDKAMLLLMLDTGLRVHEAFSLTQVQASQEATTIKGKGGKERLVLISAPVRLSLLRYRKAAPKSEALWLGHEGPLTLKGMILVIRSIGKRAGVKPFGPHRLRRTFATWSLRNGMDLESLRRLMGHSSLTILQQYLNLVDTDLKEAHRKFSPVLQLGKK